MFGIELTWGWIVALALYFLGGGMVAWGASMRGSNYSPRSFCALVVCWPLVGIMGTFLFLFPSLNRRIEDRADELDAASLRREQRAKGGKDDRRGPPPPAFGSGA